MGFFYRLYIPKFDASKNSKMKKYSLVIVLLLTIIACNTKPEGFVLNGDVKGEIENGTQVFLKKIGDNNQPTDIDTTTVENGKFQFLGVQELPEMHYVFVDKLRGYTAVVLENGEITLSGQKDSMGLAAVSGTVQNDYFSNYMEASQAISKKAMSIQQDMQSADEASREALRDEMNELQDEYKNFESEFIKSNPDALIAVLLLDRAIASRQYESSEIQKWYDALTPEMKKTNAAIKISEQLNQLKEKETKSKSTAIGAKAPEFTAPGPDGEQIALKDVLGKVTLVDFWAAWCKPCRAENPNVVAAYKKYHDKGLNILGVSLDRKADAWKKAIADDGLEWNHVSHVQYFGPIAKLYNVDAIPAAFLLDENGVIIAKNLRGKDLHDKISEILD